jgi:hypothetical protein
MSRMDPADTFTLAYLLLVAALIAGTCEYGEIIRRRKLRREDDRERLATDAVVRNRLERLTPTRRD